MDLSRGELPKSDSRAEIHAVLLFGYSVGAPPGPGMLERFDCNIVPSLAVYDDRAGKTRLSLTDAKSLALPTTPEENDQIVHSCPADANGGGPTAIRFPHAVAILTYETGYKTKSHLLGEREAVSDS